MPELVDLHMHSTWSDGVLTPRELLNEVRSKNLKAFSITDHDSIDGYLEVRNLLTDNDPELIPGVELSTTKNDNDLHLLVYAFNPDSSAMSESLEKFRHERNRRADRIVERLNSLGVALRKDQVETAADGAAVGRPHVAHALYKAGFVSSRDEAFSRFLGKGRPAYIPKMNLTPREAIDLGHAAGGVVIMAHPMLDRNDRYIEELSNLGMDGIEIHHPYHRPAQVSKLRNTAEQLGLLVSGGSDFHGRDGRYGNIGCKNVPAELLEEIKKRSKYLREPI